MLILTDFLTNTPSQTDVIYLDISKAFDTVCHETLLEDIYNLELNHNIKRFLTAYLRGRQTFVEFRGKKSSYRKMIQGVPQGGVLSPTLFNIYMSHIPSPPNNLKLVTYADDSTALNSGPKIQPLCDQLNTYLDEL